MLRSRSIDMVSALLKYIPLYAAALGLALIGSGCDERKMTRYGESETYIGTHQVTIRPGSPYIHHSTEGSGRSKKHEFTCAEHRVILNGRELLINNLSYGEPPPHSSVLIEYGNVFINGVPSQGKPPKSSGETVDSREENESTTRLGGYPLKIRPGHAVRTRFHIDGAHTLRLRDNRYTVKEDEFFINDVSFGKLYPGDEIVVDHGTVLVSGRERAPAPNDAAN